MNSDSKELGGVGFKTKLYLNTLENSRKTFARLLRKYARGEIDRVLYRDLVYGLTGYLGFFRTEIELQTVRELEDRLKALEAARV